MQKTDLLKEISDVKNLMSHLEDEYRKANVSEKSYQELREKYSEQIEKLEKKAGIKKDKPKKKIAKEKVPIEEENEEAEEPAETEESEEVPAEIEKKEEEPKEKGKPKIGFLSKLLKKNEKPKEVPAETEKKEGKPKKDEIEVGEVEEMTPEVIEKLAQQVAEQSGVTGEQIAAEEAQEAKTEPETSGDIEIEKLKVMIEGIRETNRTTEETIRNLSESIGEIRSMVFQADGSLKETSLKLEKIETDIAEVKPKEIEKKFRELSTTVENFQMQFEKMDKKSEDLADKINKVYEILKAIGGIENLINLNKDIQVKISDIKEALSYTERLSSKTEKIFIDLSRNLDEFAVYKSRQDGLDETVKDELKAIDAINVKFDSYPTKKDLENINSDISVIRKQIEEISKILPAIQTKLPEIIEKLKKEKEDILMFLEFSEQQAKIGAIGRGDFELSKQKNMQRLEEIDKQLQKEWEDFKEIATKTTLPKEEKTAGTTKTETEVGQESEAIKTESVQEETATSDAAIVEKEKIEPEKSSVEETKVEPKVVEEIKPEVKTETIIEQQKIETIPVETKSEITEQKVEETKVEPKVVEEIKPEVKVSRKPRKPKEIKEEKLVSEQTQEKHEESNDTGKTETLEKSPAPENDVIKKFDELLQTKVEPKESAWKKLKGLFRLKL
jgi:hypothetical protein